MAGRGSGTRPASNRDSADRDGHRPPDAGHPVQHGCNGSRVAPILPPPPPADSPMGRKMLAMSSDTADTAERVGEQEESDQIKAPFGVAEAIKLYEAAFPHYKTSPASPVSSTTTLHMRIYPDKQITGTWRKVGQKFLDRPWKDGASEIWRL